MAKKKRRKYKTGPKKGQIIPITKRQRAFGTVAKAANAVCHRDTNSVAAYKKCMKTEMSSGMKKAGLIGKKKAKASPMLRCKGVVKTGARRGRLKKGYTYSGVEKGRCPVRK